jgi:hypothetical protein
MPDIPSPEHSQSRPIERVLALLAAALCLGVTIYVWQLVSPNQPIWPIPALYLIEMLVLTVLAALTILPIRPLPAALAGIAFGGLSAFSVLASFSVGLFYYPVALLLLTAGLLFFRSTGRSLLVYLAWAAAAAVIQTAIILAAIRLLYPA